MVATVKQDNAFVKLASLVNAANISRTLVRQENLEMIVEKIVIVREIAILKEKSVFAILV